MGFCSDEISNLKLRGSASAGRWSRCSWRHSWRHSSHGMLIHIHAEWFNNTVVMRSAHCCQVGLISFRRSLRAEVSKVSDCLPPRHLPETRRTSKLSEKELITPVIRVGVESKMTHTLQENSVACLRLEMGLHDDSIRIIRMVVSMLIGHITALSSWKIISFMVTKRLLFIKQIK